MYIQLLKLMTAENQYQYIIVKESTYSNKCCQKHYTVEF